MSTTDTITVNLDSDLNIVDDLSNITNAVVSNVSVNSNTISANPYYGQIWNTSPNGNALYDSSYENNKSNIYICEEWESKKPMKIKDGMFVSLKEDLYSVEELEDIVLKKIENEYPEALIKLGTNIDSINIKKHSIPIEINTKE